MMNNTVVTATFNINKTMPRYNSLFMISSALCRKMNYYNPYHNGYVRPPDGSHLADIIRQLSNQAKETAGGNDIKFRLKKNNHKQESNYAKGNSIYRRYKPENELTYKLHSCQRGLQLVKFILQLDHEIIRKLIDFELYPTSAIFMKHMFSSGIINTAGHNLLRINSSNKSYCANALNSFVKKFRVEYNTVKFKERLNKHIRRVNKNRKGIEDFINYILEGHSRILAIRIDCSYRQKEDLTAEDLAIHIAEEYARDHLKLFMQQIKKRHEFEYTLGYVIKMERGIKKGLHFHMLFFMDSRKHQKDILLADMFGNVWEEVTDGEGLYFNCNKKWKNSPLCAVGTIHREDHEKIAGLKNDVITYMTKIDEYVLFRPLLKGRTLFRSQIKKARK